MTGRPVPSKSGHAQTADGTDFLMPELTALLATAAREINTHVNDHGICRDCGSTFPCPRAQLAEFTLGSLEPAGNPQATTTPPAPVRQHCRAFAGTPSQVREARRFLAAVLDGCPVASDAVLCLSELASNSILYSDSRKPGATFTVRAEIYDGDYVWIEVEDDGGPWQQHAHHDGRPHGLDIVRELTSDCGRDGDAETGWVMWARLDLAH